MYKKAVLINFFQAATAVQVLSGGANAKLVPIKLPIQVLGQAGTAKGVIQTQTTGQAGAFQVITDLSNIRFLKDKLEIMIFSRNKAGNFKVLKIFLNSS